MFYNPVILGRSLKPLFIVRYVSNQNCHTKYSQTTIPLALQSDPNVNKRAIFKSQNTVDCNSFPKYSNRRKRSALTYLSFSVCKSKMYYKTERLNYKKNSLTYVNCKTKNRKEPLNLKNQL